MKRHAPLLTLVAVAVLGVGLLVVNNLSNPAQQTPAPAAAPTVVAPTGAAVPEPTTAEVVAAPAVVERVYAGRSSGNEVTVAIAVLDGRAVAYVCDGDEVEAWLEGTLEGDQLSLRGADGASITGTVDDAAAFGTVAADGRDWPYSAEGVEAPEGLYEGRADIGGVANRIGWIVLDGTQTGSWNRGGELLPPPVLDPANLDGVTVDGRPVPVRSLTGADDVTAAS